MTRRVPRAVACTSFAPIVGRTPRVLVLGSMPGVRSLAEQRYYAHPHNRFWRVMAEVCGLDAGAPYARRVAQLKRCGIALWDVLAHCERSGSLDGAIVRESEVPNDVAGLLAKHRSIGAVALNGGKAALAFAQHVVPALDEGVRARVAVLKMPSTSPANASVPVVKKVEAWRGIGVYLKR